MAVYTGTFANGFTLRLTVEEQAVDAASNSSPVRAKLEVVRSNGNYPWGSDGIWWTLTINGVNINGRSGAYNFANIAQGGTFLLRDWWQSTVIHDTDGSKTISVFAEADAVNSAANFTVATTSGTLTLKTIPRASTFVLNKTTLPLDGSSSVTATITRASSSFTHKVEWLLGGVVMATQSNVATSQALVPANAAWLAKLPNSVSGTATCRVTTMTGSSVIGTPVTKDFTVTVPADIKPSLSSSIARSNQSGPAQWIAGKSKAVLSWSALTPGTGATLTSLVLTMGSQQKTLSNPAVSGSWTTPNPLGQNDAVWRIEAKDSRGRVDNSPANPQLMVWPWSAPSIKISSINRTNSNGTVNNDGTYVTLTATCTWPSTIPGNTLTTVVKYRVEGASSWTSAGAWTPGTAVTFGGGTIDVTKAYQVRLEAYDSTMSASAPSYVQTLVFPSFTHIARKAGGTLATAGVGIGGTPAAGQFRSFFPTNVFDGNLTVNGAANLDIVTAKSGVSQGHLITSEDVAPGWTYIPRAQPGSRQYLEDGIQIPTATQGTSVVTVATDGKLNGTPVASLGIATAWDSTIPDTTAGASGWVLVVNACRRRGKLAQITFIVTNNTGAAYTSNGDVTVGNVAAGFRPISDFGLTFPQLGWHGIFRSGGNVDLTHSGSEAWANGAAVYGWCHFFLP